MLSSRDVLVQMTDVTSIVKSNKEVQTKVDQFSQVGYILRHDLVNNLNNLEWVLAEIPPMISPGQQEELGITELLDIGTKSVKQLTQLMDGLRDWTRAIEGKDFVTETFDLTEALSEHIKASEYGPCSLEDLGTITANKGLLINSVFKNLIHNSFYYGDSNTRVRIYRQNNTLILEDTVPGGIALVDGVFSKERFKLLLQPFQRGASEKPGTGLGLAITNAIIQKHGWGFGCDSDVGGSRFIIQMG
jgi:signal transduction histidine kinase